MFRKLTNRMTAAANSVFGNDKVNTLVNMGFDATQATNALEAAGGNVERAAEILLISSSSSSANDNPRQQRQNEVIDLTGAPSNSLNHQNQDEVMERVMRESLKSEEDRMKKQNKVTKKKQNSKKTQQAKSSPPRASGTPAAKAAAARFSNTNTTQSSQKKAAATEKPKYKMPTPLKHKSKEEQITRLAARLSPYPRAVDTLTKALTALKNDPSNPKYRTIDKNTAGYQSTLQNVPSVEDLLLTVNFQKRSKGEHGILVMEPSQLDIAILWIAISAIEKASKTKEYQSAKKKLVFENKVRKLLSVNETQVSEAEINARLDYSRKLCTEPRDEAKGTIHQNVTLMHVHLLPEKVVKRRFDGDDQLRDVIFWMGTFDSTIPDKIKSGEWCLVDKNMSNPKPIPCDERSLNMTLQRIGCWPSGRLELREGGNTEELDLMDLQAATRGLGVTLETDDG